MGSLNTLAWKKLKRDKLSFLSLLYIIISAFIGLFAVLLSPDNSINSNEMHIELATQKPLSEILFLEIPNDKLINISFFETVFIGVPSKNKRIAIDSCKTFKNKVTYYPFNSKIEKIHTGSYQLSKQTFWFGTDKFGRDFLSRILNGIRISLSVGFFSVFISLIIGITLGLISGYFGGFVDNIVMWFINVIWSIPTLLMVIAITLALGKGFWQIFLAIGLTMWVEVARVVRGQVITEKNKDYITATKVLGFSDIRIFFNHLLPNIIGPILIISAANFASAILIESGLSFLGIGTQPPVPSWGSMIKDNYQYIILGKAYLAIIPGTAIMLLVTSFMFLGNNLEDYFKSD